MNDSVGRQLRTAREARGWSVEDVAGRLKISARYVIALEGGDTAALPEPTFVRGYIKAYAKAVALDADALLAASAPVEVKAPRPLIGPEGQVGASRPMKSTARGPSFRVGSSSRLYQIAGGALLVGVVVWLALPGADKTVAPAAEDVAVVEKPVVPSVPSVSVQAPVVGGVTLAVPLPGPASAGAAPATQPVPAAPASSPATAAAVAPVAAATTAASVKLPVKPAVATAASTTVTANSQVAVTPAVELAPAVAAAPRKGLFARFSGTCWVEVRDADNVVVHTRIAMAGNEMSVDGKAPLTVTLGDSSAAEVWYNGDRVAADKFSSNGIARIIVGQSAR